MVWPPFEKALVASENLASFYEIIFLNMPLAYCNLVITLILESIRSLCYNRLVLQFTHINSEMLLEFADALDFAVVNTWFKKEVRKMITYETKACKTVIDFFLIRKSERKLVRDVKVVHEECIKQHKLLICVLDLKEKLVRSKVEFMKRCKVWKLKEAETEGIFRQRVQARVAMQVDKPRDAEGVWKDLKKCILSEAISVCGETKGMSRHKETWWWNDEVAALVQEKKCLFRLCQERCRCVKRCRCEKENYNRAKRAAKLAIFKAKNAERLKFCEELKDEDWKGNVFRVAKQLVRKNRDVVGAGCVRDNNNNNKSSFNCNLDNRTVVTKMNIKQIKLQYARQSFS